MKGARDYAKLLITGQRGRLYIVSGDHARGRTFRIFVLPEGEAAKSNGWQNAPLNDNAVEVYGVIGGQLGWTEVYGWIHEGPWQEDFLKLYILALKERAEKEEDIQSSEESRRIRQEAKMQGLLSQY